MKIPLVLRRTKKGGGDGVQFAIGRRPHVIPCQIGNVNHLGFMNPPALVLEWFSYLGRKLGRVWENVFLCLEAQVAGLSIYTTRVCQIMPQFRLPAHFDCVESACVTLRGKAIFPPMLFMPSSLSTCEYGPLGTYIFTAR